jgi:hypothetical protein
MSNINIADFKRPGVYIRENDASLRQIPAQNDLINLVAGFSRKGPVNKPVLITTPQQLFEVFGDIDRLLEKKGCFFHRTILNILRNSPVWAVNLLSTDDNLDLLEWKSISVASDVANGETKKAPYSSFFNKSEFWYRDTDAFLAVAQGEMNPKQILHITNMGDKKVSVFMFKSSSKGYDVTLENWYGGKTNVPAYLNSSDLASDYLVNAVIVAGDWSDYKSLSVDSRWSKYFNVNGLRKEQVGNFINDRAVNILKSYSDLSIVPYFKDLSGRDMFIETVINRDTDITGVFVAYDIDAVESSDYSTGLLDLIGSNIVNSNEDAINYLSYKETITEGVSFNKTVLNRAGNAFGDTLKVEGSILGDVSTAITLIEGASITEAELAADSLQYVLNGIEVSALKSKVSISLESNGVRKDTLYVDTNGVLGVAKGISASATTPINNVYLPKVGTGLLPIATLLVTSTEVTLVELPQLSWVNTTNLSASERSKLSIDVEIKYTQHNKVEFIFINTNESTDKSYKAKRLNAIYSQLQSNLKVGSSVILDNNDKKIIVSNAQFHSDKNHNKYLTITLSPTVSISERASFEIYFKDDELSFNLEGAKTEGSLGVVGSNSSLYKAFKEGVINTGDYFYPSLLSAKLTHVEFISSESKFVIYYNDNASIADILADKKVRVVGSQANDITLNIVSTDVQTGTYHGLYNTKLTATVSEYLKDETVSNGDVILGDVNDVRYLRMFFVNDNLTVQFADSALNVAPLTNNDLDLNRVKVFSKKSNYKQTLEIEGVLATNKVLVKADRYAEVKKGDYLKAFINEEELELGEVAKSITRIVDKKLYAADPTLVELTTDAQIAIEYFGNDAQTTRFTIMEDYIKTYQAFVLGGFKMRADSMPNGTEERQSKILDVLAKGTPLFKGLTNRNKISWRYLVDCFGLGLTSNSKHQLVELCAERLTCLGFINMPSAKDFKNCTATNFLDKKTKTLRTDFIAKGGDPESNPAFLYSFAQGAGQSNVGYFFPNATIEDNGRPLSMPLASFICNTYMNKHTSRLASVKPWSIAAGITNGLITGIGNVEIDLTEEDIENLNGMNANPVVYKMNRGFAIETNNTAQVSPRTALSYINVREVLINLEEDLYQMLLTYQWRANTKEVRDEIKTKADTICEKYVRGEGLYDFINIIDDSNNTSEYIDAQMGILDTFVEPVKAMGYIVNNITILKTGDIRSGGFRNIQ